MGKQIRVDKHVAAIAHKRRTVFSHHREATQPLLTVSGIKVDEPQQMDGLKLLAKLPNNSLPLVFFDPQYRSILDKQAYGNEGKLRGKKRSELPQMSDALIAKFIAVIEKDLMSSGHLMLWVDKYIMVSGRIQELLAGSRLQIVDMITWDKQRMGMGYRTRRHSEYLVILQKPPVRAKGVWKLHDIPDVWPEKIENGDRNHTHVKPFKLQARLIEAVTNPGDVVVDPAAGGYSVLKSTRSVNRHFIGCDILEV
jgi:site-specific DNA-methyltransferase (adenine-specific)